MFHKKPFSDFLLSETKPVILPKSDPSGSCIPTSETSKTAFLLCFYRPRGIFARFDKDLDVLV